MNRFLTLKVLVCLFTLSVSGLAQDLLISRKKFFRDKDEEEDERDDDDGEDDSDYLGIYIAVGVIGSIILILIFVCCLCRCCIRRRQSDEVSASSKTVLAVVPRPRHLNNSISNESYTGPSYPHSTYGSASAPYDYASRHSYQNRAYDGYSDSGHYEAPPPYFEHGHQNPPEESVSVDIPGKAHQDN